MNPGESKSEGGEGCKDLDSERLETLRAAEADGQTGGWRETDNLRARIAELEKKTLAQLEERWLRVPVWRRAIILGAQWVQFKFMPKQF